MDVPRVVFRIQKIKSWSGVGSAAAHNLRLRETPNANPAVENIVILGPSADQSVVDFAKQKLSDAGVTIRKNAVLCVESVISASPEYFRPDSVDQAGFYEPEKLKAWRSVMEPWIAQQFPHAVSVVLHLDEVTPHYQVLDLPLRVDEKSKTKLDARTKYGGDRDNLRAWQTRAAEPVAALGIERGIQGSKAKHQTTKRLYGAYFTKIEDLAVPLVTLKKPKPPVVSEIPGFLGKMTDAGKAKAAAIEKRQLDYVEKKKAYDAQVLARRIALEKVHPVLAVKAQTIAILEHQMAGARLTVAALEKENMKLKTDLTEAKKASDRMRALPLGDVLVRLYGAELANGSKETHATRKYNLSSGEQVAVSPGKNGGEVWKVQGEGRAGGKGAIDLVIELDGSDYKSSLKALGDAFGAPAATSEHRRAIISKAEPIAYIKELLAAPAPRPVAVELRWPGVRAWLNLKRALPFKLIDFLHAKGLVYADKMSNAVFPRARGGAFLRGTYDATGKTAFKGTVGTKADGPYVIQGTSNDHILCESAIDACSIKTLYPDATVIATGGSLMSMKEQALLDCIPVTADISLAFDADKAGQDFTREAQKVWHFAKPMALPKGCKDWNEALQKHTYEIPAAWSDEQVDRVQAQQRPATKQFSFARPKV